MKSYILLIGILLLFHGCIGEFIELDDAPSTTYAGKAGMAPRVNGTETGLEWYTPTGGSYVDQNKTQVTLTDTVAGYLGTEITAGTGITLANIDSGGGDIKLQITSTATGTGTDTNCSTSGDCNSMYVNVTGDTINGDLNINGDMNTRAMYPQLNNTYNLGTATHRYNTILANGLGTAGTRVGTIFANDVNFRNISFTGVISGGDFNYSLNDANDSQSCGTNNGLQSIGNTKTCISIPTETHIDTNALEIINGLDLNNSLAYTKWNQINNVIPWADINVANNITLDNLTQITTRNYSDLQNKPTIPTDTNCSTSADCNTMYVKINPLNDQNINSDLNIINGTLAIKAGNDAISHNDNVFEIYNQNGTRTTRIDQNGNIFIDGNFTCIDANCFIGGINSTVGRRHFYNGYQYTGNAPTGQANLWISGNTYAFGVTGTAVSGLYFDASAPRGFKFRIDGDNRFTVGGGSTNVDGSVWQTLRYANTIGQPDGTWSFRDLGYKDMNWQPYIRRNGTENHINAQVYLGTPKDTTYTVASGGNGNTPNTNIDANWTGDMNIKGDMYFDANRFMIQSINKIDTNVSLNLPTDSAIGTTLYANSTTEHLYYYSSDASTKTNIQDINQFIDYNKIAQLQPKCWDSTISGEKGCGFIAQEVQPIFPQVVYTLPNGLLSIKYDYFNILLVEAIQKQMQINATTKAKLNQAEAFITAYCTTGGHQTTPECQAVLNP